MDNFPNVSRDRERFLICIHYFQIKRTSPPTPKKVKWINKLKKEGKSYCKHFKKIILRVRTHFHYFYGRKMCPLCSWRHVVYRKIIFMWLLRCFIILRWASNALKNECVDVCGAAHFARRPCWAVLGCAFRAAHRDGNIMCYVYYITLYYAISLFFWRIIYKMDQRLAILCIINS